MSSSSALTHARARCLSKLVDALATRMPTPMSPTRQYTHKIEGREQCAFNIRPPCGATRTCKDMRALAVTRADVREKHTYGHRGKRQTHIARPAPTKKTPATCDLKVVWEQRCKAPVPDRELSGDVDATRAQTRGHRARQKRCTSTPRIAELSAMPRPRVQPLLKSASASLKHSSKIVRSHGRSSSFEFSTRSFRDKRKTESRERRDRKHDTLHIYAHTETGRGGLTSYTTVRAK